MGCMVMVSLMVIFHHLTNMHSHSYMWHNKNKGRDPQIYKGAPTCIYYWQMHVGASLSLVVLEIEGGGPQVLGHHIY